MKRSKELFALMLIQTLGVGMFVILVLFTMPSVMAEGERPLTQQQSYYDLLYLHDAWEQLAYCWARTRG